VFWFLVKFGTLVDLVEIMIIKEKLLKKYHFAE